MAELRRFTSELVHGGVVPAIERRVASLFANVNSSRKGVRNVLKSWLRRPREAASALSGAPALSSRRTFLEARYLWHRFWHYWRS
jgi:hypothetical protein